MDLTGAAWRKASRSGSNGTHCVEVAAVWRKASRSGTNGANCVEVAPTDRAVAVRDSKNRTGPALAVGERGWRSFLSAVKGGRLGL